MQYWSEPRTDEEARQFIVLKIYREALWIEHSVT